MSCPRTTQAVTLSRTPLAAEQSRRQSSRIRCGRSCAQQELKPSHFGTPARTSDAYYVQLIPTACTNEATVEQVAAAVFGHIASSSISSSASSGTDSGADVSADSKSHDGIANDPALSRLGASCGSQRHASLRATAATRAGKVDSYLPARLHCDLRVTSLSKCPSS